MRSLIIAGFVTALSFSVAHAADKPTLNLCTGSKDGDYYPTGESIRDSVKRSIKVNVVETSGSEDNYRLVADGTCDGLIAQNDMRTYQEKKHPEWTAGVEFVSYLKKDWVHLICNRESGISAIKDYYGSQKILISGPPGSGSQATWDIFGTLEKRYIPIKTSDVDFDTGLTRIIQNDAACMLWVANLNSNKMKKINELGKGVLQVVPLNDGDLDNAKDAKGKPLYTFEKIPGGTYYNLQYGMFGSSVKTVTQRNVLAVSKKWKEANQRVYGDLSDVALRIFQQNQ